MTSPDYRGSIIAASATIVIWKKYLISGYKLFVWFVFWCTCRVFSTGQPLDTLFDLDE